MSITCSVGKAIKQEGQRIADQLEEMADEFKRTDPTAVPNAITHLAKAFYYSTDGMLRTLAMAVGKDGKPEPTIEMIADMLFAPVGRKDKTGIGVTAPEAIDRRVVRAQNKLADVIIDPFKDMRPKDQAEIRKQVVRKITSGNIRPGASAADKAAAAIRDMLKEWHAYAREAGMDIGDQGARYFPRVPDTAAIFAHPEKFKVQVTKLYRRMGEADPREKAEALYRRIREADLGFRAEGNDFVHIPSGTGTKSEKGRVFGPEADEILKDFMLQDPIEVLSQYFSRMARRAEWVRRFGPNLEKWQEMKAAILKNVGDEQGSVAVGEVVKSIQAAMGLVPAIEGAGKRNLAAGLRVYGAIRFLTRATYASLTEPLVIASRSGNVLDAFEAYRTSIQDIMQQITGTGDVSMRIDALRDLAEDIGVVNVLGDAMLMTARVGGDVETRWARRAMGQFFVRTGLHDFTEGTRVAAVSVGRAFLRRLAKSITKKGIFEKSSRRLLGEAGVPADRIDSFAGWLSKNNDGLPTVDTLQGKDADTTLYRDALARFVEQSILKPKAVEKPRGASHPYFTFFYQLKAYMYGFQKNVLNRVGNMTLDAAYRDKDLNIADRIRLMGPAMALPLIFAGQAELQKIRESILDDPGLDPKFKEKTDAEEIMTVVSRSQFTGTMDPFVNMASGRLKYGADPAQAILGPTLGTPVEILTAILDRSGDRNSPNTNTEERKFWKTAYETVAAPLMVYGLSLLPGKVGALIGAGLIQTVKHPATRENAFVKPIAGPPKFEQSGGGGRSGRRSTRSRRSSARSGGRRSGDR